jgi:hypothetical protein
MSKNVSSGSDLSRRPDNPQETFEVSNFYYSGFFAAEMSCSIIKATNHHPRGHYYAVDITVSNADKKLLEKVNRKVMKGYGVISSIKGAYNLSARGKEKVRIVLNFLKKYPIIIGDFAKNRIAIISSALLYLDKYQGHEAHADKTKVMDEKRNKLRMLKEKGIIERPFGIEPVSADAIGYFLSGIADGEGSFGLKMSDGRKEPYFFVAMKDRKIVDLFQNFVNYGNLRLRRDKVFHCEINKRDKLKEICTLFLQQYPLQHARQRARLQELQRILNDYTPSPVKAGMI